MIRFGLCCIFRREPIKFRRTTATLLKQRPRKERVHYLRDICMDNARALEKALVFCRDHGIGAFRINSQILPLKTHPEVGYGIEDLPDHHEIEAAYRACGRFCREHDIRTSFHPDQFIVLSSPDPGVVRRSIADLVYHAEVAEWVRADVINIHGGGGYGDKPAALERLETVIEALPESVRSRLTLENDDRTYTPRDLLPVCRAMGIPLVYDVHHHRCLPDGMKTAEATEAALETWQREPLFHVSSPLEGWQAANPRPHHDYLDPSDFPDEWKRLSITVEVEAKAKELAVMRLMKDLELHPIVMHPPGSIFS